jgi:hypothetical protein
MDVTKASLNGHFTRVSCTFNEMTHQQKGHFCMKWGGERTKSFHHGETLQRRFPGLGNAVKRPLRGDFVSFSIPCAEAPCTVSSPPFARVREPPALLPALPPASSPICYSRPGSIFPPRLHRPRARVRRQIHRPWSHRGQSILDGAEAGEEANHAAGSSLASGDRRRLLHH